MQHYLASDVCEILARWQSDTGFAGAFLFGSLIHKDGLQFEVATSDIDVCCSFGASVDYRTRAMVVESAQAATVRLNCELMQLLKRADATRSIVSIVPLTVAELGEGIHKSGVNDFFSIGEFVSVGTLQPVTLGGTHPDRGSEVEGALDAVRNAQRARNAALSWSPNGIGGLEPYDGPDPLPKDYMRCAAQVRYALEVSRPGDTKPDPTERVDLSEGLYYAQRLVDARRNESSETQQLWEIVAARVLGRGGPHVVTPAHQLLLWEILAEDACALVPPRSFRGAAYQRSGPSAAVRNAILARDGMRCAFPGCGVDLTGIGEVAAIRSMSEHAPRFDPMLSPEHRCAPDNYVSLCPTHHRMIDARPEDFPVDYLVTWQGRRDDSQGNCGNGSTA